MIHNLKDLDIQYVIYEEDANHREISAFILNDVSVVGKHYPGIKLFTDHDYYDPIRESIMSMPDAISNSVTTSSKFVEVIERRPVFFFVYNVDNYYHFLYDTLPYLITFRHLRKEMPELKLLINTPPGQKSLNQFVIEFLELLDIHQSDLLYVDDKTLYKTVYVSSSYTHDNKSNVPPREEIYSLYKELADKVASDLSLPKKIYVSRRSHKHGNYDNIGTNYTSKRKCINEDEIVSHLELLGYTEVFTELLSTKEKIALFKNCTHVIGPIGGGICNVLFSLPTTKLIPILSPYFLDINSRFCYSFKNVDVNYFRHTKHVETSTFKKYMRVRSKFYGLVGEIVDMKQNQLKIMYSDEPVAGWNAQAEYKYIWIEDTEVEILDPGLNSAWITDIKRFKEFVNV